VLSNGVNAVVETAPKSELTVEPTLSAQSGGGVYNIKFINAGI
jgi:hypothetical protein